jgi:hypothetical protein
MPQVKLVGAGKMVSVQEIVRQDGRVELESTLAEIIERIKEQDTMRCRIATIVKKLKDGIDLANLEEQEPRAIVENKLVVDVEPDILSNIAVAGVDGGMLSEALHGLDLVLTRAVAVMFRYRDGQLSAADYYPGELPEPRLIPILEPLDAREFELVASMQRQLTELRLATLVASSGGVDMLLLDGSVVPQYVDRFPHRKKVIETYRELLQSFFELYEACGESNVLLAGVVKDSRATRFLDILRSKILQKREDQNLYGDDCSILLRSDDLLASSRDTVFLDHMLEAGERSCVFKYADAPGTLLDLNKWSQKIYAFYIKTVPYDYPLRVEFVDLRDEPTKTAERMASVIYALSQHHDAYGLPSVLIEADARARLEERDLDIVHDSIVDRLGPSVLMDLRRDRRPF